MSNKMTIYGRLTLVKISRNFEEKKVFENFFEAQIFLILIHSLTYFLILFSSELNDFINGMGLISENKNKFFSQPKSI